MTHVRGINVILLPTKLLFLMINNKHQLLIYSPFQLCRTVHEPMTKVSRR